MASAPLCAKSIRRSHCSAESGSAPLLSIRAGDQKRPTETRQMHQIRNDQTPKPAATALIHRTGDDCWADRTDRVDRGKASPPADGGSTTPPVTLSPCECLRFRPQCGRIKQLGRRLSVQYYTRFRIGRRLSTSRRARWAARVPGLPPCRGQVHPFTAPAVSPWIKCRCRKLNSTATGTVLRMTPADSGPHCTSYCPTM